MLTYTRRPVPTHHSAVAPHTLHAHDSHLPVGFMTTDTACPPGPKEGGSTSLRTQTEIAMRFAWGTASHCIQLCDCRLSDCMGVMHCTLDGVAMTILHWYMSSYMCNANRTGMQKVPCLVGKGGGGKPVHHGIVERSYDKLRAILQIYCLDKQEDRT